MLKRCVLSLLASILVLQAAAFSQKLAEVRRSFAEPPADARIMMRWWWFGPSVTKEEIEKELRTMKEGGIGGVEVQPVYPLLPDDPKIGHRNLPYLSDEFLAMLKFASERSKELGMRFDLTLGSGWSFGGARTPITEAAGQLRVERVKLDASIRRVPVPSMISAEKFLGAFHSRTGGSTASEGDLQELTDIRDGNVWLPAGTPAGGEILFFISGKSGMQVKRPSFGAEGYVLNHLDGPSVENYLKQTGDRLFQAFGKGNVPYSVFCDSLEVYNQDWTDGFLEEFQKRRGYDLKPHLPALALDIGPATADVRYDWGQTLTELFNERFMMPMQAWSKRNGTRFRIQGYGIPPASISSNEWADISDGEGAQWKVVRASRWASSANHIYGRPVTSSETWTWLHSPSFRATPLDMKAEADIHFLQGINQLIGHGWAYTPPYVEYPGWRFYAAGEYSDRNPWWIVMPDLARYLQRMSYLMRQGTPKNDVAFYLPTPDAYSHFSAGRVHLIDADRDLVGEKILPSLFASGFNLDFFDDAILGKIGSVQGNEIALGASRHRAIVLPGIERMPLASIKKIEEFVKAGGVVVATRRLPAIVPGRNSTAADQTELKAAVQQIFGGKYPTVKFVRTDEEAGGALARLLTPDLQIAPSADEFGFVHRRIGDAEVYFIANTSNRRKEVQITLRDGSGNVELFDGMTGKTSGIASSTGPGGTRSVDITFEPYQSWTLAVSAAASPARPGNGETASSTSIDLSTGWTISFKDSPAKLPAALGSWTADPNRQFYSGIADYARSVDLPAGGPRSAILDLGQAKAVDGQQPRNGMQTWIEPPVREAAVIYVNGVRAGSLWCPPYRLDIAGLLKPGRNDIRITVANTALNVMAGRKLPDYKLLNLRYGERFQPQEMEKVQVLESGLMGPIRLEVRK